MGSSRAEWVYIPQTSESIRCIPSRASFGRWYCLLLGVSTPGLKSTFIGEACLTLPGLPAAHTVDQDYFLPASDGFIRNYQACSGGIRRCSSRQQVIWVWRFNNKSLQKRKIISPTSHSNGLKKWPTGLPEIPVTVQLEVYWPWTMSLWYQSKMSTICPHPLLVLPRLSDSGLLFLHLGHSFFQCLSLAYDCLAPTGACHPPHLVPWWVWDGETSLGSPPSALSAR